MLVYPKELSNSLDCTPRTLYPPHYVSKSARLVSLDLPQCPDYFFSFYVLWFNNMFYQAVQMKTSYLKYSEEKRELSLR